MITPSGYRLLVKTQKYEDFDPVVARAKAAGLTIEFDSKTRYDASVDEGFLIAAGPDAWSNSKQPWAKVGDKIAFAKNAGKEIKDQSDPETRYVLLNDEDVLAVLGDTNE